MHSDIREGAWLVSPLFGGLALHGLCIRFGWGSGLAVPIDKVLAIYTQWQKPEDLNPLRLKTISHFFEHYKDLEKGKWVKLEGWGNADDAKQEIVAAVERYRTSEG